MQQRFSHHHRLVMVLLLFLCIFHDIEFGRSTNDGLSKTDLQKSEDDATDCIAGNLSYVDDNGLLMVDREAQSSACHFLIERRNCSERVVSSASNTTTYKTIILSTEQSLNFTIDSSLLLVRNLSISLRIFATDSGHLLTLTNGECELRITLLSSDLLNIHYKYGDTPILNNSHISVIQSGLPNLNQITVVFLAISFNESTTADNNFDFLISNDSLTVTVPTPALIDPSVPTYLILGADQQQLSVPVCLSSVLVNNQILNLSSHTLVNTSSPPPGDMAAQSSDSTTIIIVVVVCVLVVVILAVVAFFLYRYIRRERATHGIYKPNLAESRAAPDMKMVAVIKVPPPERLI